MHGLDEVWGLNFPERAPFELISVLSFGHEKGFHVTQCQVIIFEDQGICPRVVAVSPKKARGYEYHRHCFLILSIVGSYPLYFLQCIFSPQGRLDVDQIYL